MRIGSTINSTKTGYMIAGRDSCRTSGVSSGEMLDGVVFEVVEFVFLGTLVTWDNDVFRDDQTRIAAAYRGFADTSTILTSGVQYRPRTKYHCVVVSKAVLQFSFVHRHYPSRGCDFKISYL